MSVILSILGTVGWFASAVGISFLLAIPGIYTLFVLFVPAYVFLLKVFSGEGE